MVIALASPVPLTPQLPTDPSMAQMPWVVVVFTFPFLFFSFPIFDRSVFVTFPAPFVFTFLTLGRSVPFYVPSQFLLTFETFLAFSETQS